MKTRANSLLAAATAVLFAFLSLPSGAAAAGEEAVPGERELGVSENSHWRYRREYADAPYAAEEIPLADGDAVLAGDARRGAEQGREGLVLEKDGSAAWTVQVPETARYTLRLDYCALPGDGRSLELGFTVDGEPPCDGAGSVEFKRLWKDAGGMRTDSRGNDVAPEQEEVFRWQTAWFEDTSSYTSGKYALYLTAGEHTVAILNEGQAVAVTAVALDTEEPLPTYGEVAAEYERSGYAVVGTAGLKYQAEETYEKSDSVLIPVYDRTGAATEPNDPAIVRRNTIGQTHWSEPGMWVSYRVSVPEDGLYRLVMKSRQNTNIGLASLRNLYIDGEIPFQEAQGFVFPYSAGWQMTTFGDEEGNPYLLYLTAGEHEIRLEATLSRWSEVLNELDEVNSALAQLYRKIVMVTGTAPDVNRDYRLDEEIPGLTDAMAECSERLYAAADRFVELNNGNSGQASVIRSNAKQLASFVEDPDTIPGRLARFLSNISALSEWMLSVKSQPLELDYFLLLGEEDDVPSASGSFWDSLTFSIRRFFASFVVDYNAIGGTADTGRSITVWFSGSRDQAQIVQDLIESGYSLESGVHVNLSLVYQGFTEATLAGVGPDVALDVARSYPVNLACRGALTDLSAFDGFEDVMSRFLDDAAVPYTYQGGVYGLPSTLSYYMMFYRTDIFEELGLEPPDTWEDFYELIPALQRNNYEIGLPYSAFTAAGAADAGIGAKDLYATLLFQNGGSLYQGDLSATDLHTDAAFRSFEQWTEFYTVYSFPITYNLTTRFRAGTLPLVIGGYGTYNSLAATAPEIRGLWAMAPVPATVREDGSLDRSVGAAGSAHILFKDAENPQDCWDFLSWWTSAEAQYEYGMALESLLGASARSSTATLEAFDRLPWDEADLQALQTQRESVRELPEVPGNYMVSRSLDNAFRAVVYNGRNPRERFEQEVLSMDEELARKRIELGLQ
ncbi:MAG TPA: extracellular solute-binding protein [Firmicutes bacterium]|nr:extracellular solute-binding protein [Bacillota bacterium]